RECGLRTAHSCYSGVRNGIASFCSIDQRGDSIGSRWSAATSTGRGQILGAPPLFSSYISHWPRRRRLASAVALFHLLLRIQATSHSSDSNHSQAGTNVLIHSGCVFCDPYGILQRISIKLTAKTCAHALQWAQNSKPRFSTQLLTTDTNCCWPSFRVQRDQIPCFQIASSQHVEKGIDQ
uniref:Uncharacterized protein n=1 Tax=Oryza punctata TaxID=4537 RepID=A0A0E0M9Q8_ORYPU